ncbi:DUF559 domain-containing protein [Corynebacterium sp. NPDC060344]|uniref:DUF559 domain-containing protein n=1 Tax=Corynebacterium sp. NPDC060344 TaxID=3347101 RepID=UPI0036538CE1
MAGGGRATLPLRKGGLRDGTSMAEIGDIRRRSDLIADGLTRHEITRAESEGWLLREGRSAYRFAVTGLRLRMELVIARAPDAVFSHRIAAFEHRLLRNPPARLDAIVPRKRGTVAGAHVWRRDAVQAIRVRGMRVTSVAQTLADMADEWGFEVTARILDDRFPTPESRVGVLRDFGELPAAKQTKLGPILRWAPVGRRSKAEGRIARALQLRGYDVALNVKIGPYSWDIVHEGARLIIEYDSRLHHDNSQAFRTDRARQNNLIRRGYRILRYIDDDVELGFDRFIDEICSTIDWLLGQPLRTSEWDETYCEDLYIDRQIFWEQRNQAAWPHW